MRAAVLRTAGEPVVVEELTLRALGPRDVRVRIAASGVCHSDLSMRDGSLPAMLPCTLGHEGAGVITDLGAEVTRVAPGDHVVLTWNAPCRECYHCVRDEPHLCVHGGDFAYLAPYATGPSGGVWSGLGPASMAEETVLPETAVVRIDPEIPLEQAALLGCGMVTGVGAVVRTANVQPGETVLVLGCGGVGLAAIQGARLAGAGQIIAADLVTDKLALAAQCGATDLVSDPDLVTAVRALTDGIGVDHAVEVVGRPATIRAAYDATRRGGTLTVVGAAPIDAELCLGALSLMADAKTIRGSVYGSTDPDRDIPALVDLMASGAIDVGALITRRITLDGVEDAFTAMTQGEVARSVIVFDGSDS